MTVSIAIADSTHGLRPFVIRALLDSGVERASLDALSPANTAQMVGVFGIVGLDEFLMVESPAEAIPEGPRAIVIFEYAEGLTKPQARLRRHDLELQVHLRSLQAAPASTINAIVVVAKVPDAQLERDVAATVRFIACTSAMTGQVFILS